MKVPLSWLHEYIDLEIAPQQIAKLLTSAGLEVDAVEKVSPGFENVVIAKVLATKPHPNADKLCVATVFDGEEEHQVVCGAPNCRPGIKTAFAKIGAVLSMPNDEILKIKKTTLRGVESSGMLCSLQELGLSANHDGIAEFDEHLQEGMDVADLYSDIVFDISLTPNMWHCASILGVARELSALTGKPVKPLKFTLVESSEETIEQHATVDILDEKRCPRYCVRLVRNVQVLPSPDWLQRRLEACGVRPVNNIVDITNYVMLELGQPLHAFDFSQIAGGHVMVRMAEDNESFETLDHKKRVLCKEDLMIADSHRSLAFGGVMGGLDSEVTEKTLHVLLESAYFQPNSIRRTSKRHGLISDASKRFEKGIDPNGLIKALNRAAYLIEKYAKGVVCRGIIDKGAKDVPLKTVNCRLEKINGLLGTHLSVNEVEHVFQSLHLEPHWDGNSTFSVTIPSWRVDINIEADLIEEIARIYGYDKIPRKALMYSASKQMDAPMYTFEKQVRSLLISTGLQELLNCDLIGPKVIEDVYGKDGCAANAITVLNPVSIDQSILRTSLLPGLLANIKHNFDRQQRVLHGFEIGKVHFSDEGVFREQLCAAIILTGTREPYFYSPKPQAIDFYDIKGLIETFLSQLNIGEVVYKTNGIQTLHPGRQLSAYVGQNEIGSFGELHPSIIRRLGVNERIYYAEFNLQDLCKIAPSERRMKDIAQYPSSERDWTITLNEEICIGDVLDLIKKQSSLLLEDAYLLDIYRSPQLGVGIKNVTFRLIYRDNNKTLSQEIVEAEHNRIVEAVSKGIG